MRVAGLTVLALTLLAGCSNPPLQANLGPADGAVEAISLLGDSLRRPSFPPEAMARMLAQLDTARRAFDADTGSADSFVWYGRRTGYLGRYQETITIFNFAIDKYPDDPRMYRHRGHRYLTTRQLDGAVADFKRAAELIQGTPDQVEPDGQPNALGIPTSTLHSNIWYHLGLALYLKGDFAGALEACRKDLEVATNPDMQVAVRHWLYMTLRRLGRAEEAAEVLEPVTREMEVIENTAYHRLLLLYKGKLSPDSLIGTGPGEGDPALQDASVGYGLGNWHFYNGREQEARAVWRRVVQTGPWASFGYLAAEAELAREAAADAK